jgi:hypothetical protein
MFPRADIEIWRPVVGVEGYQVSSLGRVKSLRSGRILKTPPDRDGYPTVNLGRRRRAVHQLVLLAFVGPCPPGRQCRHLDGRSGNARLSDLVWGTPRENYLDRVRHGTVARGPRHGRHTQPERTARGKRVCGAKLTAAQIPVIRELVPQIGQVQTAKLYGVSRHAVGSIVRGQSWRHIPKQEPRR